ncbi:DNA polymerase III subunit alpha, partial [bacterium]|nr:DNA polymerase III subunit alpha [bacterium]
MFVHLHNHSDYSILDGACKIAKLVEICANHGSPGVALTDHGNLFGVLEFYSKAKDAGINPLIGSELYVARKSRFDKGTFRNPSTGRKTSRRFHQVLIAKNYTGYQNLTYLCSRGFTEGFYHKPRIDKELLAEYSEGLICLSACLQGEIPQAILKDDLDNANELVRFYKKLFGDDFYLEIQRHGIEEQERIIPHIAQLAEDHDVKLVATNDSHYLKKEHSFAHDILLCIGTQTKIEDENRMRFSGDEFYLKSPEEMAQLFPDFPEAVENTLEVSEKCELEITLGEQHYPVFQMPDDSLSADEYLRIKTEEGFQTRYGSDPPQEALDRMENELNVISATGFSNYFLIVWDFVKWARENDIPVGPGRGSAAGCTVSYCLKITNLDPTKFGLIFERFLNPERVSPPDIDIDFSDARREDVISYVRDKYGKDSVCRITTFGKMAAKSAIRDVARTLDVTYAEADKIAKLIPEGPKVTLETAHDEVPELRKLIKSDSRFQTVWDNALIIEGTVRQPGTHAAGVVICPGRTVDFIPVHKTAGKGEEYTQYDMNWIDKLGLLKVDFLGLQTLSELDMTVKALEKSGTTIDLDNIDLKDDHTYSLFGSGSTVGIFQFESKGMRGYLSDLKPEKLDDIIAMAALYRPGPMDNIPEYIKCRHGKEPRYEHDKLKPILEETYGVITYQEQVIKIATDLAGFTLGKADILRGAMGKKKMKIMQSIKPDFLTGCEENDVSREKAMKIWDACEQFAKYGFVKAHAAGYAMIAYQCAYLKTHYTDYYLASCLTVRRKHANSVMKLLAECKAMGVEVLVPDVNESEYEFVAVKNGIRFGLAGVKNLGDAAIKSILDARKTHGRFTSFHNFLTSVDLRTANKKVIESLIEAGAFGEMGVNRATMFKSLPGAVAYAQAMQDERDRGQTTLFGGVGVDPAVHIPP